MAAFTDAVVDNLNELDGLEPVSLTTVLRKFKAFDQQSLHRRDEGVETDTSLCRIGELPSLSHRSHSEPRESIPS